MDNATIAGLRFTVEVIWFHKVEHMLWSVEDDF